MTKLRVESFTISIDGFGAGPNQSLENPLGIGGPALHGWAMATRTFQEKVFGKKERPQAAAVPEVVMRIDDRAGWIDDLFGVPGEPVRPRIGIEPALRGGGSADGH